MDHISILYDRAGLQRRKREPNTTKGISNLFLEDILLAQLCSFDLAVDEFVSAPFRFADVVKVRIVLY